MAANPLLIFYIARELFPNATFALQTRPLGSPSNRTALRSKAKPHRPGFGAGPGLSRDHFDYRSLNALTCTARRRLPLSKRLSNTSVWSSGPRGAYQAGMSGK